MKMPAVPSGAPCLSLRAACGRRTCFSPATSFPRIGAEARTTGRPHPSCPMTHRHPTLPRVCRCQEKAAERQKSVVGAPAITQKTQRCGRAAVFYPASGKNAESTCPETVADRFRCITLTAGKTPCMPEPHAGIPDPSNRCRFRDFFNKTNKNCSSLRPSSCSNVSSKGKPIVFPGHPVHAHHTVLF